MLWPNQVALRHVKTSDGAACPRGILNEPVAAAHGGTVDAQFEHTIRYLGLARNIVCAAPESVHFTSKTLTYTMVNLRH